MMFHRTGSHFGEVQKSLARALYEAGQTDREIADACSTSVNNIAWWRKEEGLGEHVPAAAAARAAERIAEARYIEPPRRNAPAPDQPRLSPPSSSPSVTEPRLITPAQAQEAFAAPVQPAGENALEIGDRIDGKAFVDLEELLTTRLLIQGNSGSGKTHLLRRLLEECAGIVQQVIIDPEGDFISFGEAFGHTVINAADFNTGRLASIAGRTRRARGSVVLNLDGLDIDGQMDAVAAFLGGLFDAPAEDWHPAIVAVDEAHLFAPTGDNGEDRDTRKASLQAMQNLMCRGRKRGLAGIIATQRLSKLHKNVAAEASNFLLGRTFLDIDINRAVDLLGLARQDGERVRNLVRGHFLALGPAISRRPMMVTVGPCMTQGKAGAEKGITPLPAMRPEDMQALLLADDAEDEDDNVVPLHGRAK
ncbi:ATP-binding protein [Sphingopyxis macrogoltabida]|uniref:AAA+ ATPase domain-containing protein n=1 Tax=Sphingopyxis macrogoltabida TaxID=33050 RepID=A0A0P0DJP9_SPHMC|nr:ATP-binding protein [Sphingopyxis macrogoltabida]ALJ14096.1 ATPase-like protein [Sphingopyxis macrogoltabida]ALJ15340.1 ATPase-like protein [Sphingopyxis macrogoltabida]AMU90366.1 hypothetical protein ATM17_15170 [Sphingopyxis macrogoltabida]AMU91589.1 hypothetical protein ATM17_21475 [Sphingopyxis macrogoltabida]